jgi:prepilin-type N-terminal cleavage/methylation domain-containing protein
MKTASPIPVRRDADGFSLVEVSVAIGIFAFVAVGILGLLPTAMKMRNDSAQETRAVMIAQEMFSSISSSGGVKSVIMRDGPGLTPNNNVNVGQGAGADLTKGSLMLGYPAQSTVPYFLWHNSRGMDPDKVWESGSMPPGAVENGIQTIARLSARPVTGTPGLYVVQCEVRSPADFPLEKSKPAVFSTYVYSP